LTLRVLHCVSTLRAGGAERQLAYLAAEQSRLGHDVHIALISDGVFSRRVAASGVTIHRLGAVGNRDPRLIWQLYRLMRSLDVDIVHTRLVQMDVIGGAAAVARGVPWVLSERCSVDAYARNALTAVREWLARHASAIEANSAVGAAYWSGLRPRIPVRVIPAAVPVEEIAAAPAADRASLAIPADAPLIVFAGRFTEQKNVLLLLDALARLAAGCDAVTVLCGDGELEAKARLRAEELGIAQRVRFAGLVDDVWSWLKIADVFVAPSHFEGRPNSVMEAAAARCPLVVSEIAAHRELLDDASALFVPADDAGGIAAALRRAIDDPVASAARAARAFDAVAPFSVAAMAARVDVLYDEVVRTR
jgi:glycosyltransferase involved in cell wall biosynthesis